MVNVVIMRTVTVSAVCVNLSSMVTESHVLMVSSPVIIHRILIQCRYTQDKFSVLVGF